MGFLRAALHEVCEAVFPPANSLVQLLDHCCVYFDKKAFVNRLTVVIEKLENIDHEIKKYAASFTP